MSEEEQRTYEAHPHNVEKFGKFAGTCCMDSLNAIWGRREQLKRQPTLFDMDGQI
jgi:hypothetical protein